MREKEVSAIPDDALEALARRLYPAIRSYFESEEGMAAFEEWKSRQGAEHLPGEVKPNEQAGRAA